MQKLTNANEHNGLVASPYDARDYTLACKAAPVTYPEEFMLEGLVPVKNQFMTPSCAAFAGSEIVEYFNQLQTGGYEAFSTEFIYGKRDPEYYYGDGMRLRDVCYTLQTYGDLTALELPGNNNLKDAEANVKKLTKEQYASAHKNRVSTYLRLNSINEIKYCLMQYGPVMFSMNIHKEYVLEDDVYTIVDPTPDGAHAVFVYGWTKVGWLIQNSWGRGWGNQGRFILPFDIDINEAWGFIDNILPKDEDDIVKPLHGPIGQFIAKIINWIVNFLTSLLSK